MTIDEKITEIVKDFVKDLKFEEAIIVKINPATGEVEIIEETWKMHISEVGIYMKRYLHGNPGHQLAVITNKKTIGLK